MLKLRFTVMFTVLVCLTGILPKTATAQRYRGLDSLGIYCKTCRGTPYRLRSGKPQPRSQVSTLYARASDASYQGNYAAALQIYSEIIRLNPQEAQAYFNRGSIKQSTLGDKAGALADFQTAYGLFQQEGDKYMTRASMEHIRQLNSR